MRDQVDAIWQKYDINKDGVLDKKEAEKFLRDYILEVTGNDPTQEEVERNFETMDIDKSGDVN